MAPMTNKKRKILAIIPARGGSKSIPRKNVKLLAGKPLIAHTIHAAVKSKYLDKIIVSTDDQEIAQVSKKAGAGVLDRPKELAQDHSLTQGVVEHALAYLAKVEKYKPDVFLILQPTSPMRTTKDIDDAVELFLKNTCDTLVSVSEAAHAVYWSFMVSGKYLKPMFGPKYLKKLRQDLPKAYITNGAICISTPASLLKYKSPYGKKIFPYVMPHERSIAIDDHVNFKLTEILIQESQTQ